MSFRAKSRKSFREVLKSMDIFTAQERLENIFLLKMALFKCLFLPIFNKIINSNMQGCLTFSLEQLAVKVPRGCRAPPPVQEEDDSSRCHPCIERTPTHTHPSTQTQSERRRLCCPHISRLSAAAATTLPPPAPPMVQLGAVPSRNDKVALAKRPRPSFSPPLSRLLEFSLCSEIHVSTTCSFQSLFVINFEIIFLVVLKVFFFFIQR